MVIILLSYRQLNEQTRRRVLVYRNGFGSEGFEIVASLDKFEDVSNVYVTHCHSIQCTVL